MSAQIAERRTQSDRSVPERPARRFRHDIQGIRAIAIILVVLYHAHVPGIRGGYVGVDVFFVISGHLITSQLVAEVAKSGRISLAQFYLRRVRRLLPSAVIVIVVTLCVAEAFAPPLLTKSLSVDGIFAAFYTVNYRFAIEGISYQNAGAAPSAFQHFWSLAAEEQFYIFWPLIIFCAVALTKRWWQELLPVFFLAVVAISLFVSQHLLATNAPMAYFSVQSRAWEFSVGALVALASNACAHMHRSARPWVSSVGLAMIMFSGFCYTAATPFPGIHAAVPVVGTALVISAGCGTRIRSEIILDNRVIQWLGRISYPWYLWHWPILILAPYLLPHLAFTWLPNLGLIIVALVMAASTYYALELPIRSFRFRGTVWAAAGLLLMGIAVTAGSIVDSNVTTLLSVSGRAAPAAPAISAGLGSAHGVFADPFAGGRTSGPVYPSVLKAVSDTPDYPAQCIVSYTATTSPHCLIDQYGNATDASIGSSRVVLLGDSHAGEWYPDVYGLAHQHGWDTEVLTKEGCPLASITIMNATSDGPYSACNQWRTNMFRRLLSEPQPRVIFIASLNYYTADTAYLASGWQKTIQSLRKVGVPIVYLRDTPYPNTDIPSCVSGALANWRNCAFSRNTAFHGDPLMSGTSESHGLTARVNIDQYLCPPTGTKCPAVLNGVLLYRDNSHVTNTAMTMLLPIVENQIQAVLRSGLASKGSRL